MHATAAPQVPFAEPDSTPLPLHCFCPGEHVPVQTPPMHVWLVQATGAPQVPAATQVCTPLPEHCVEPGEHATQALFKHAGVEPEHVDCVCQLPPASHA